MKKIISILVVVVLSTALYAQKLVIVHFNDTHSHLEPERNGKYEGKGGIIERAAFVDSVRMADGKKNVLLLHAGDFSQGTSYFTVFKGNIEIDLINAMKYDVITLGNHEFDNGVDELARRLKKVKCPVVCANYDFSGTPLKKYVKPYTIVKKAGMKIGVFGMLTDLSIMVNHKTAKSLHKLNNTEVAEKWADFLKNEKKCDLVIALTHLGYENEEYTDQELVMNTRNIDIVVGGHSHTFLKTIEYRKNKDGKNIPIVQDGCWGINAGLLKVEK